MPWSASLTLLLRTVSLPLKSMPTRPKRSAAPLPNTRWDPCDTIFPNCAPKVWFNDWHKSRRYRLTADGYRICVVYLKLFEKLYAPLTSAILKPFKDDRRLADSKASQLDKLYRAVVALARSTRQCCRSESRLR